MHISLYEFLLIMIIGQCIFLIFAIQYIPKKNTGTNRMIQYLLGIYSFYLLERVVNSEIAKDVLLKYNYFSNVFYLFIGPFIYTYIRRLLFQEESKYYLSFYHYIPVMLYMVYGCFHLYGYDAMENLSLYRSYVFYTVEILFFISITAYLIASYGLFIYYKKNENKELSFNPISINYIQVTLICLMMYMGFWLLGILEVFDLITWIERPLIYDICCVIFGLQIYIVSFYKLKYPEIFKITFPSHTERKQKKKSLLNEKEIVNLKAQLNHFFNTDKGHHRPELSLLILAKELNISTNKLSWVLNNRYKKTFYELVNEYRVTDFSEKIKNNEHKDFTVISLAYDVGFNSKSTFYKAFKEVKKMTPTAFIKEIEGS